MDTLTKEQLIPLGYLKNNPNKKIVLIEACAGSGKSYTISKIVEALKPKKGLYTAFNKAIVKEASEIYQNNPNMECRTLHALALSKVKPKLPIEDFTYECIKEDLSYFNKFLIIKAVDEFYLSASLDMEDFLTKNIAERIKILSTMPIKQQETITTKLTSIACKYINLMINDKINPTFNYLLKWFHFMLANDEIVLDYDFITIDELQDLSAITLEIFKLLPSKWKLGTGDPFQSIYGFLNLVNGFEVLEDTTTFHLTQTFRCSKPIAKAIEEFGKKHLHNDFSFTGIEYPMLDGKTAYITATNASIISIINDLHREGQGYILTRQIKEIFAAPLAVLTASKGKPVLHKKYKFLEKEYKNFTKSQYNSYLKYLNEEVDDDEIRQTVKLLQSLIQKRINIWDVLAEAKKVKRDPSVTVGTFFSLKGLGFETVYINDDINNAIDRVLDKGGPENEEDKVVLKGAYVAYSRARKNLYNARHLNL